MKANIRIINGRNQSNKEYAFIDKADLDSYLINLHNIDRGTWIVFSIEGVEISD